MKLLTVTVNYSSQACCIKATVTSPIGLWTTVLNLQVGQFFLFRGEVFLVTDVTNHIANAILCASANASSVNKEHLQFTLTVILTGMLIFA